MRTPVLCSECNQPVSMHACPGEGRARPRTDSAGRLDTAVTALWAARKQLELMAQTGTDRILELGGGCDPWMKTAAVAIESAGIDAAISALEGGERR